MCGISGLWRLDGGPVDPELVNRMRDSLAHRGPDGAASLLIDTHGRSKPTVFTSTAELNGKYVAESCRPDLALGHRRLSIIDLVTGDQPMCNKDGSLWVVFNGEIYNHRELRRELQAVGYEFRTTSDTEVILHAYDFFGPDCVRRFNGIFAFGLWDSRARRLFLARDHFGVKPLYYTLQGGVFRFASEIKAILSDRSVHRGVDTDALNLCLTLRYTPSPRTLFRDIVKLAPATYALLNTDGLRVQQYWDAGPTNAESCDEEALVEALRVRLAEAVHRQMISDVPISLSLSSGVDSSALLAIMAQYSTEPVRAFTVGFADRESESEIGPAENTAQLFGASHTGQLISDDDYSAFFDKYIWHLEEPIGNESAPAYYFVASMAQARGVKVMLNGQGPDETFAGYPRHLGAAYSRLLAAVPGRLVRSVLVPLADWLPLPETSRRMAYALGGQSEVQQLLSIYTFLSPTVREHLLTPAARAECDMELPESYVRERLSSAPPGTFLERMLYVDVRTSLPDNLLLCEDKMAMAASVEARVPYLDLEFMQLAEQVPGSLKVRRGRGKHVHRRVCRGFLPEDVVRRPKIGFKNAVDVWLRQRLGRQLRQAIRGPDAMTGTYLDRSTVECLIEEHDRGHRNHQRVLFLLLSLEAWYQTFILAEAQS
jgi:asparagine synthase (glutamine-hydrolysing)